MTIPPPRRTLTPGAQRPSARWVLGARGGPGFFPVGGKRTGPVLPHRGSSRIGGGSRWEAFALGGHLARVVFGEVDQQAPRDPSRPPPQLSQVCGSTSKPKRRHVRRRADCLAAGVTVAKRRFCESTTEGNSPPSLFFSLSPPPPT